MAPALSLQCRCARRHRRDDSLLKLRLEVRSEQGSGSAFSLAVPESRTHGPTALRGAARLTPAAPHTGACRILLVEDDPAVRAATRMLLTLEGYEVTAVDGLAAALQHARQGNRIDLLLTDHRLGHAELGTQVIVALRKLLGTPLKAVLMTGDTSSAVQELPREPDMRLVTKPFHPDTLVSLLRALHAP
jgi:CheY-like chemotaxis protein